MDWEERRVMVWDCGALGAAVGGKRKIEGGEGRGGGGRRNRREKGRGKEVKKKRVYKSV